MSEKANKAMYIVISLVVAILFWVYVDNEEGNTITRDFNDIPIEFIGATDTLPNRDLLVSEVSAESVDLVLRGPRSQISGLRRNDIVLQIDLTNINNVGTYPRNYELVLTGDATHSEIDIDSASVNAVTVKVIEMFEKSVPVEVSIMGDVADSYILMHDLLVADPSSLTVTGPEAAVDEVVKAQILVDMTNANETVSREFEYQLLDIDGNVVEDDHITVSHKRVLVTVPLYINKTLELKVNLLEAPGSMSENVKVNINPKAIEVAGEPSWLSGLDSIILGELKLKDFLDDKTVVMEIDLPTEGCINVSGVNSAEVTITFENLETKMFPVSNISAVGVKDSRKFSRVTNSVDVLVRGPKADLDAMTGEEIRIVVDVSSYTSNGTHNVPATVLVDGYPNVGAVGSYSVTCKITS